MYKFEKSKRLHTMYKVTFKHIDGKEYVTHFGDKREHHYRDSTPLNLFHDWNHLKMNLRAKYIRTHGKRNIVKYSPLYFTYIYLYDFFPKSVLPFRTSF